MQKRIPVLAFLLTLGLFALPAAASKQLDSQDAGRIARQVRRQLVMLPFYSIFDHFEFQVEEGKLTLSGQVRRPALKKSAERVARRVEGVNQVVNEIEVLPLSPYDDRIRLAVWRSVYGDTVLNRYALQPYGPIHIIVDRGKVTLKGVVAREMEKNIAGLRANGVSGVFSVKNELRVEKS